MRTRSYPWAGTAPRKPWPTLPDQAATSALVWGSLGQSSSTSPTATPGIAFLASSSGPGHPAPRASTTLATLSAATSASVSTVDMWSPLVGQGVGRRGDLDDEAGGGDDLRSRHEVFLAQSPALQAGPTDQQRCAQVAAGAAEGPD